MFYDSYVAICKKYGQSPTAVLGNLGISKSVYTNWRLTGAEPLNKTKKLIANYFGISVEELENGQTKKPPVQVTEGDEMEAILEAARGNSDLRVLFSRSSKATPDEIRKTLQILKTICGDEDGRGNC